MTKKRGSAITGRPTRSSQLIKQKLRGNKDECEPHRRTNTLLCEATLSVGESDFSCAKKMVEVSQTVRCINYHIYQNLKAKSSTVYQVNCTCKALFWLSG